MSHAELRNLEPPVQDIIDDPMTQQIMQRWGVQTEELIALLAEAKKCWDHAHNLAVATNPKIVTIN